MDIPNQESFEHYRKRTMASSQTPRTLAEMPTPPAEGDDRPQGVSKIRSYVGLDTWVVGPRYQIVRILGRGSYGEVVEAIDKRNNNQRVAIKRMQNIFTQPTDAKRVFREMHILRHLSDHPQVIRLMDVVCPFLTNKSCSSSSSSSSSVVSSVAGGGTEEEAEGRGGKRPRLESERRGFDSVVTDEEAGLHSNAYSNSSDASLSDIYLVFEYVDTDLFKLLASPQYLSAAHVQTILHQILLGLRYLHSANVIHRDLKPANILLNEDCSLKICDFGLSRVVSSSSSTSGPSATTATAESTSSTDTYLSASSSSGVTWIGGAEDGGGGGGNVSSSSFLHKPSDSFNAAAASPSSSSSPTSTLSGKECKKDGSEGSSSSSSSGSSSGNSSSSSSSSSSTSSSSSGSSGSSSSNALKRQLTRHVVTRWYRAPELILLQEYSAAVDVWSVGCIFAELLGMQKESVPLPSDRQPLFPGRSCYPLSCDGIDKSSRAKGQKNETDVDRLDQLNVIFEVIGTPSEEDIASIDCSETQAFLRELSVHPPKDLSTIFAGSDPLAIDLMRKLLCFSPEKRITVEAALEHPYFKDIYDSQDFTRSLPMSDEVENASDEDLSVLRAKVEKEILKYQQDEGSSVWQAKEVPQEDTDTEPDSSDDEMGRQEEEGR